MPLTPWPAARREPLPLTALHSPCRYNDGHPTPDYVCNYKNRSDVTTAMRAGGYVPGCKCRARLRPRESGGPEGGSCSVLRRPHGPGAIGPAEPSLLASLHPSIHPSITRGKRIGTARGLPLVCKRSMRSR